MTKQARLQRRRTNELNTMITTIAELVNAVKIRCKDDNKVTTSLRHKIMHAIHTNTITNKDLLYVNNKGLYTVTPERPLHPAVTKLLFKLSKDQMEVLISLGVTNIS